MPKNLPKDVKMLLYFLITDQKENQFFFLSEFNDTEKRMSLKFEVLTESYELCGKSERLYKTNFQSLIVSYQGGSEMPGGEIRTKEYSSNAYEFSIDNTSQVS